MDDFIHENSHGIFDTHDTICIPTFSCRRFRADASENMDESTSCLCFKLSSEKSSPGDIVALQWSPKMDLLAMAMKDGSVSSIVH